MEILHREDLQFLMFSNKLILASLSNKKKLSSWRRVAASMIVREVVQFAWANKFNSRRKQNGRNDCLWTGWKSKIWGKKWHNSYCEWWEEANPNISPSRSLSEAHFQKQWKFYVERGWSLPGKWYDFN